MNTLRLATRILPLAALVASAACLADSGPAVSAAERQEVVASVIREMNQKYVFPEMAKKVEAALRQQQAAKAFDSAADGDALARRLTESLQAVTHDKHVGVRYSLEPVPVRHDEDDQPTPEQLAEWDKQARYDNFEIARVERLPGNIGYLDLRGFLSVSLAGPALSAAMSLLANTDTLIVDVRQNGGGDPETVALVCSYLFDHRTHLNSLYWRKGDRTEQFWTQEFVPGQRFGQAKPVYVLTSSETFSAAEEFSYDLRTQKRATLVGETTGGGANPGGVQRLSEHFEMFVPGGRAVNPITGINWEGTGVEPHVKVAAAKALDTAQAMALKALIEREKDDDRKKEMRERLAQVETALR